MFVMQGILAVAYWLIYLWIAVFTIWNVFVQKNLYRQISAAMIAVPYVVRLLFLH
jgi:hypothetical protein